VRFSSATRTGFRKAIKKKKTRSTRASFQREAISVTVTHNIAEASHEHQNVARPTLNEMRGDPATIVGSVTRQEAAWR
jgi:hypothetical protein